MTGRAPSVEVRIVRAALNPLERDRWRWQFSQFTPVGNASGWVYSDYGYTRTRLGAWLQVWRVTRRAEAQA